MNKLKRALSLALSIVMLMSALCLSAAATETYTPKYTEDANILYELGLFGGMGTDADGKPIYGLEQKATRLQGLIILIKLLGEAEKAEAFTGTHPFTDVPAWGEKYVAYAYAKGYTAGKSETSFGSNDMLQGKAFSTFVLKALGYDANSDFSYNTALEKAAELGLIQAGECNGELYRDHCVMLSRNALRTNTKDSNQKLVEKLLEDSVVSAEAVETSSVFDGEVKLQLSSPGASSIPDEDILAIFPDAAFVASKGISMGSLEHILWNTPEVRRAMVANNHRISKYFSGELSTLPEPNFHPSGSQNIYPGNSYTIISVINSEYQLIGYTVIPPYYSEDTVIFTTCRFGGIDLLEELKSLSQDATKHLKKVDSNDIYRETITTILADGTEQFESYLRIKETKIPEGAKYYELTHTNKSIDALAFSRMVTFVPFRKHEFGVDQFSLSYSNGKDNNFLLIFDENKNIIAYANMPDEIPVERTVIEVTE